MNIAKPGRSLELFFEKGFSVSILTKSDLVVRDMDILQEMDQASVSVSVAFNDNQVRQQFEANTIDTEARIGALHKLREAGIKTSALICPVIPYITDVTPLINMLAPHTGCNLDLRPQYPRAFRFKLAEY